MVSGLVASTVGGWWCVSSRSVCKGIKIHFPLMSYGSETPHVWSSSAVRMVYLADHQLYFILIERELSVSAIDAICHFLSCFLKPGFEVLS